MEKYLFIKQSIYFNYILSPPNSSQILLPSMLTQFQILFYCLFVGEVSLFDVNKQAEEIFSVV